MNNPSLYIKSYVHKWPESRLLLLQHDFTYCERKVRRGGERTRAELVITHTKFHHLAFIFFCFACSSNSYCMKCKRKILKLIFTARIRISSTGLCSIIRCFRKRPHQIQLFTLLIRIDWRSLVVIDQLIECLEFSLSNAVHSVVDVDSEVLVASRSLKRD